MGVRIAAVLYLLCHGVACMTDDEGWGATVSPQEDNSWGAALPSGEADWGVLSDDAWEQWPDVSWPTAVPEGCQCWNTTDDYRHMELECRCTGDKLTDVPTTLHHQLSSLTVTKSRIKVVKKDSFQPYKDSLKDITLADLSELKKIERGAFRNLRQLRTVYITETPILKILPPKIFDGLPATFRTLRIVRTGLEAVPDMVGMGSGSIVHMIDLESNRFKRLKANFIRVKAERLLLSYNVIESVDGWAFNGSEIAKLSLSGNKDLSQLSMDAFQGLKNLQDLDLSQTAITALPVQGLENLEILRIKETESLKVVPSVYNFRYLQEAQLTYSFHCCAFKFPAKHDPSRHARHQAYLAKMREYCDTGQKQKHERTRRQWDLPLRNSPPADTKTMSVPIHGDYDPWDPLALEEGHSFGALAGDDPLMAGPVSGDSWHDVLAPAAAASGSEEVASHDLGHFHQTTAAAAPKKLHALCGNLSSVAPAVVCRPTPDALNPCEDIMGYVWLRVSVWFVVVTAVLGNLAVLAVLLSYLRDLTVPRFLMCHLALADLCMGIYLLTLASMDLRSSQYYFNFAYDWQIGHGCQVAGFLTVFASQLSIYTLSILTLERWFAITFAIYLNKRLKLRDAAYAMVFGWLYSVIMAALPLMGVNGYSATSICLPMRVRGSADVAYLACLLLINFLAFLVIVVCYVQIYLSLGRDTRGPSSHRSRGEMNVAKKMALLVFTDFACWAPIAFFSLTALAGYPLIDVTRSKILLVFFYPLNSCANPYLYAILTAQYRKDLFLMLARYGLCTRTAQQYKMAYSLPTTNNSNNIPFIGRPSDSQANGTNNVEEMQLTLTSAMPQNGAAPCTLLMGKCNGSAEVNQEVFV